MKQNRITLTSSYCKKILPKIVSSALAKCSFYTKGTFLIFLLGFLFLYPRFAIAGNGLLPSTDEMFGVFLPSIEAAIQRPATTVVTDEDGKLYSWEQATDEEYTTIGIYLCSEKCSIDNDRTVDDIFYADIVSNNHYFSFEYDRKDNSFSAYYPNGTRPKADAGNISSELRSILPSIRDAFGTEMPNMSLYSSWNVKTVHDNGEYYSIYYEGIKNKQYEEFGSEASALECTLDNTEVIGDKVKYIITKGEAEVIFSYDISKEEAMISYNSTAVPAKKIYNDSENKNLLPELSSIFGATLPSAGTILQRWPDNEMVTPKEHSQEYTDFTDDDYNKFSIYLSEQECSLIEYINEDDVITITLAKNNVPFVFSYDRKQHIARTNYSVGSRPETVITPSPVPTEDPNPEPTPSPTKYYLEMYAEFQCYDVAISYLKTLLKNPNSLIVNSYTSTKGEGTYTFVVDYSAQNSFGGYTRNSYLAIVSYTTGEMISGITY